MADTEAPPVLEPADPDRRLGRAARLRAAAEDLAKLFRQQVHELDRLRVDRAPKEDLADAGEAFG